MSKHVISEREDSIKMYPRYLIINQNEEDVILDVIVTNGSKGLNKRKKRKNSK